MKNDIPIYEQEIRRIIKRLDTWINEVYTGGCSTQHAEPMKTLANRLRRLLNKKERIYGFKKKSNSIIENL